MRLNSTLNTPSIRIPGAQPLEEAVLWRDGPNAASLARRVFKAPLIGAYFVFLLADGARSLGLSGRAGAAAWQGESALLIIGALATGSLWLFAWLTARYATYEITTTHLVMRFGVALRATLAIPFGAIETVAVRVNRSGSGDVVLRLKKGAALNYLKIWPHARPGSCFRPDPMLRCLSAPGVAASILVRGVEDAAAIRLHLSRPQPDRTLDPSQKVGRAFPGAGANDAVKPLVKENRAHALL